MPSRTLSALAGLVAGIALTTGGSALASDHTTGAGSSTATRSSTAGRSTQPGATGSTGPSHLRRTLDTLQQRGTIDASQEKAILTAVRSARGDTGHEKHRAHPNEWLDSAAASVDRTLTQLRQDL